jgi:acyl-coenzyme A thioesterase PaaI-like protein
MSFRGRGSPFRVARNVKEGAVARRSSTADPALSHHPMGSSVDPAGDPARTGLLRERREAITELGAALRGAVQLSAATEAPAAELRRAAARLRALVRPLAARRRDRHELPSADDLLGGVRLYNPVCGPGSALAPPLRIEPVDGGVIGRCTLDLGFEGPPGWAHGGVSAMLLDQLLGYAVSAAGHPGMTVELTTRYRAPVPLQTPLHLAAGVTAVDGRRVTAHGSIAVAQAPGRPLVEATGVFVGLTPEQARQLFPAVGGAEDENVF